MTQLCLDKVSFGYRRDRPIFKDLSLKINVETTGRGHVVAIMGTSGSGKSTLLRLISRLEIPQQGHLITDPINPVISYVPQESVLFEHLSRQGNARYFEKIKAYRSKFHEELFDELSSTLGMKEILEAKVDITTLSGGERQRLALLRALSVQPDLLLMDEPCTGLDTHVKLDFLQKLRQVISRQSLLALYITHHPQEAMLVADEVVYLLRSLSERPTPNIIRGSVREFATCPAALEAAKLFSSVPLNVLSCVRLDAETLLLSNLPAENGVVRENDEVYLAFAPDLLTITEQTGFAVEVIGENPLYTYLRMQTGGAVLVAHRDHDCSHQQQWHVKLDGIALLYGPNGMNVQSVGVKSYFEGSQCLKIYHSS